MKRLRLKTVRRTCSVVTTFLLLSVAVAVLAPSTAQGADWFTHIHYSYEVTGAPEGATLPTSMRIELVGHNPDRSLVTVTLTLALSDGESQTDFRNLDLADGGGNLLRIQGVVPLIPFDRTTGDALSISGVGVVPIEDETTRTYVGASRTVVSATVRETPTESTHYWDKKTGFLVEISFTAARLGIHGEQYSGLTITARAIETNIPEWGAPPANEPSGVAVSPTVLLVTVIVGGALAAAVVVLLIWRRRRSGKTGEGPEEP